MTWSPSQIRPLSELARGFLTVRTAPFVLTPPVTVARSWMLTGLTMSDTKAGVVPRTASSRVERSKQLMRLDQRLDAQWQNDGGCHDHRRRQSSSRHRGRRANASSSFLGSPAAPVARLRVRVCPRSRCLPKAQASSRVEGAKPGLARAAARVNACTRHAALGSVAAPRRNPRLRPQPASGHTRTSGHREEPAAAG
jgi:hypothetical protein